VHPVNTWKMSIVVSSEVLAEVTTLKQKQISCNKPQLRLTGRRRRELIKGQCWKGDGLWNSLWRYETR